ncbi:odorant receptor 67d-like [Musca autumnalis]|uniref:odorant receptor 67d-like n=1 Tax=Musca autumnalis TaxID=221902 RepID=UPI003CF053E9
MVVKKHSERLLKIVRVTRLCADVCGADILNENYRVNVRTVFIMAVAVASFSFFGYTINVGYAKEKDWKNIIKVITIAGGTLLQALCFLVTFIAKQKKVRFLFRECCELYQKYELIDSDYRVYLNQGLGLLLNLMKICAIINFMLVFGMCLITFLYNIIFEARETILYGYIPTLDVETDFGFYGTNAIYATFVLFGAFGLYASDVGALTLLSQVPTFKGILQCKFRQINKLLDDDEHDTKIEKEIKTRTALKDILQFHQKYLIFLGVLTDSFYWIIIAKVGTCFVAIVCALFCIMLGTWPAGYIYMTYCFVMLQVFCAMGTLVDITNEEFIHSCYYDVHWYKLSIKEKKMLCFMLMMAQNTQGLTVGSVMRLSMNTGLQISKTIYSLTMFLLAFVK